MYSVCLQVFAVMQKKTHLYVLTVTTGSLRANVVLIWPSVKMSLTALALNLTSSEMMYRLPADFMAIYKYFLDLLFFIVKFFFNLKSSIISLFSR